MIIFLYYSVVLGGVGGSGFGISFAGIFFVLFLMCTKADLYGE